MPDLAPPIAEFFAERPAPARAILLGKGPSLDSYDPACNNGAYVLGLNETAMLPELCCNGVVFLDGPCWGCDYPSTVDVFRPYVHAASHGGRGWSFIGQLNPIEKNETGLHLQTMRGGTPSAAIAILARWGVHKLDLWGFDTMWTPSGMFKKPCADRLDSILLTRTAPAQWERITKDLLWGLHEFGFDWTAHHG